jgi:hypothetical protein
MRWRAARAGLRAESASARFNHREETKDMKRILLSGAALIALAGTALAAPCPAVTVADPQGVAAGAFPQQYDLAEFQTLANCTLEFAENPAIRELNAKIRGNPELPPVEERLPEEPLVIAPYESIGKYGGTFDALSNASEPAPPISCRCAMSTWCVIRTICRPSCPTWPSPGSGTTISPS